MLDKMFFPFTVFVFHIIMLFIFLKHLSKYKSKQKNINNSFSCMFSGTDN